MVDPVSSSDSESSPFSNKKTLITPRGLKNTVELIDCIEVGKKISCFIKENCSEIGVIAEGSNVGPYGELSFLAIGAGENVFVLDVLTCPQLMRTTCFKKVLEGKNILKIMYNSKNLSAVLYGRYSNTLIAPVFDVQCAHAFVASQNKHCSPFDVPSMTLPTLCQKYTENNIYSSYLVLKSAQLKKICWWDRPFSSFALKAIAAKIFSFYPDVYINLKMQIHPLNLENFYRFCSLNVICHIFPEIYERERNEMLCKLKCSSSTPPDDTSKIHLSSGKPHSAATKQVLEEYEHILNSTAPNLSSCKRKLKEDPIGNISDHKKAKLSDDKSFKGRKPTTKQLWKIQTDMLSHWREEENLCQRQVKVSTKSSSKTKTAADKTEKTPKKETKDTPEWQTISPDFLEFLSTPSTESNRKSHECKHQCECCKKCKNECDCSKCKKNKE